MGILSALLGADAPAAQWAKQNRGWVGQIGAGIAAGPTFEQGLANAAMMGPQGQRIDDAYAAAEAEKAARQDQINQTSEYLAKTFPDLAQAVSAGMPLDSAWNEAMKRSQPGYGAVAGEQFTLGPGEVRFGPDGKPIAQGPAGLEPTYRPATAAEKAAFGLPADAPVQMGPKGIEVVSGADKYAKTTAASERQADSAATATDTIVTAAGIARKLADNEGNVGMLGAGFGFNPTTDAAELRRQVDVLKSNASIENLTAMRQESPTGAALGSVTQQENVMLAAAAGALDPNGTKEQFQAALDNYEKTLLRIVHGREVGDQIFKATRDIATPPGAAPGGGMDDVDAILKSLGM